MNTREPEGPFSVDPQVSERIREEFQRQRVPAPYSPERIFTDHDQSDISEEEKKHLTNLAQKVGLNLPHFKRDRTGIISILEDLGQDAFPIEDYTRMNDDILLAYYKRVQVDIGMYIWKFCPDIIRAAWAEKSARTKSLES